MAVAPLFIASLAALKAKLRLSGGIGTDAAAIIDQAIKDVWVGFYERLGAARVTFILVGLADDSPTSAAELLRARAESVEAQWVRLLLWDRLPIMHVDGAAAVREQWNDEGLTRRGLPGKGEKERLQAEVEAGLAILAGDATEMDLGSIRMGTAEPDDPALPGSSIWQEGDNPYLPSETSVSDLEGAL